MFGDETEILTAKIDHGPPPRWRRNGGKNRNKPRFDIVRDVTVFAQSRYCSPTPPSSEFSAGVGQKNGYIKNIKANNASEHREKR